MVNLSGVHDLFYFWLCSSVLLSPKRLPDIFLVLKIKKSSDDTGAKSNGGFPLLNSVPLLVQTLARLALEQKTNNKIMTNMTKNVIGKKAISMNIPQQGMSMWMGLSIIMKAPIRCQRSVMLRCNNVKLASIFYFPPFIRGGRKSRALGEVAATQSTVYTRPE